MIDAEIYFFVEGEIDGSFPKHVIFYGLKMKAKLAKVPDIGDVIQLPESLVDFKVESITYLVDGSIIVKMEDDVMHYDSLDEQLQSAIDSEEAYLEDGLNVFDYGEKYLKFKNGTLNAKA